MEGNGILTGIPTLIFPIFTSLKDLSEAFFSVGRHISTQKQTILEAIRQVCCCARLKRSPTAKNYRPER